MQTQVRSDRVFMLAFPFINAIVQRIRRARPVLWYIATGKGRTKGEGWREPELGCLRGIGRGYSGSLGASQGQSNLVKPLKNKKSGPRPKTGNNCRGCLPGVHPVHPVNAVKRSCLEPRKLQLIAVSSG